MTCTRIIIPAKDYARVEAFYRDTMGFVENDGELFLPTVGAPVSLHLIHVSEECEHTHPPKRNYPVFWYRVERNFLTYCHWLQQNGVRLGDIHQWQGGFHACIYDPEENMFGLWCDTAQDSGEGWDVAAQAIAPFVRASVQRDTLACSLPFSRASGRLPHDAPAMPAVTVVLPVADMKRSRKHYRDVFGFREEAGLFYLPTTDAAAALELRPLTQQDAAAVPSGRKFMSFEYEIAKNFQSCFMAMFERGASFDMACEHPGGYFARVSDPDGNQFEIHCASFEEDEPLVDPWRAPFYFRY